MENGKEENWMEEFLSNSPNPIIRAGKGGTVLYANRSGEPLLELWETCVGEGLPPGIRETARKAILRKRQETLEVKVGEKVYSIAFTPSNDGEYTILCGSEITSLKLREEKMRRGVKMHEALSRLRELAFRDTAASDPRAFLDETAALVAATLEVEFCAILKLLPGGDFSLEAGTTPEIAHSGTTVKKETARRAGYTLLSNRPVFLKTRDSKEILRDSIEIYQEADPEKCRGTASGMNTASGMSTVIGSAEKPLGIMAVHSKEERKFTKEDAYFLSSAAAMVSEAIEKRKIEEKLLSKVRFLETLLDTIPAPVFYKDEKGVYQGCNELFAKRILGIPKEKVTGCSIDELEEAIPTELGDVYRRMDAQLLRRGGAQFYESKVMCADRVEREFSLNKATYRDLSGKIEGLVGVMLDITGRKRTEENLQKSEERYRLIAEQTGQLIYGFDLKNGLAEWGGAFEELTGYSSREVQNFDYYNWVEHIHPEDRRRVQQVLRKCWSSGEKFHEEFRFRRKDGSYFYVENKGVFTRDEDGRICRALGVMKNVTEIKLYSEKLKESEELYRTFLENFRGIVFQGKMDFSPVFMHGTLEEITGYREEDINSGRFIWDRIVHPEDLPGIIEDAKALRSVPGTAFEREYRIRRKDGKVRWVYEIIQNIPDASGKPEFVQGALYDITEKKIAQQALARVEEMRKKEIHHRIKNNLQVVSSLLNLQAEKFEDKKVVEAFRESENRVISMCMIHEELYKSRDMESIDFTAYLRKLTADLLHSYRVGNERIHLHLDVDDIFLGIDTAIPLGTIINELFSNSLKYAFPEGAEGNILISLHREPEPGTQVSNPEPGSGTSAPHSETSSFNSSINSSPNSSLNSLLNSPRYTLVYSDNGTGFPENIDFKKTETLGLQLVHALVEQIDGQIELETGKGTAFSIIFSDPGQT